jgi:ribosomal protein S1
MESSGVRGFLPVSQLSVEHYPRVEGGEKTKILEQLKHFIGQELTVRIIDFNPREEKLIFSEREANEEAIAEALKQHLPGEIIEGEITATASFGAFMKFGTPPLEGLVHISELDYKLIEDPGAIVKVGDKVKAKIIAIEDGRISLSLKALKEDPWNKVEARYLRENIYAGLVKKINRFGALVELDPEIYGLCHISQFENPEALKGMLEMGKTYPFSVLDIQPKERRLSLKLMNAASQSPGGDEATQENQHIEQA